MLAWQRYLRATRGCPREVYEEIEAAAWRRLEEKLEALECSRGDSRPEPRSFERSRAR